MTITDHPQPSTIGKLYVELWGDGTPVVLVHGGLATGAEEWDAQRPLASEGFRLLVFDRRGYGHNAFVASEDFLADADDIAELLGDGAHIVGHSYGGLGAMLAAARRPEATLSLTLLEAPVSTIANDDAAWTTLVADVTEIWHTNSLHEEWVVRFLTAVGSDPSQLPPEIVAGLVVAVPPCRYGRPFYEFVLPEAALAAAAFPKLVVSGGHHPGFDAMCDDLATRIGATRATIQGAGHEIQFAGDAVNRALATLWTSVR